MKSGLHPGIVPVDPGDAASRQPLPALKPTMINLVPPRPPQSVAEALGAGATPDELSTILAARFRTVCEDGVYLSFEKRSVQGVHFFLAQLELGVDLFPLLEWVKLFRFIPDGMVYLMHSLLSFQVYI